jgi:branched-chain amino acid transport system substrate-binding protein
VGKSGIIKVGGVFPLSGPLGAFGQDQMQMMRAIFTKVNQEGGIAGTKIEFIVYDDQFDPAQGKRYVRELIAQKIFAFAGWTPGTYEAVKADLQAAGIPGLPMDVGVERQRTDRLSFPPHSGCLRAQAGTIDEVARRGRKKIAFIELDIEAVHRCIDYSVALAKKLGIEVVYRGNVAPGAPDCGPQLLAARGRNPDVLIPFVEPLGGVKCLQAKEQQGWKVDVELGVPLPGDTQMIEVMGKAVEGVHGISMFGVPGEPEWEARCGVVRQYFPNDKYLSVYSSIGCVSAVVLVTALQAVGPGATQAQVIEYLESHPVPTRGITPGDMRYRPGDHRPHDLVIPMEIKGGRWVRTGPPFTPTQLSDCRYEGDGSEDPASCPKK